MEKRRTMLSSGIYQPTTSQPDGKIQTLGGSHPFLQQLEVVFPANDTLLSTLQTKKTASFKRQWILNEFIEFAKPLVNAGVDLHALGSASDTDDVWCLDARGVLTLSVGKETYERLGIVGAKLPWKPCQDLRVISITLLTTDAALGLARTDQASYRAYDVKTKAALESWDKRRNTWDVVVSCNDPSKLDIPNTTRRDITAHVRKFSHTRIPQGPLPVVPQPQDVEHAEDWEEEVSALFEWVGLAGLGSQRLQANDRVDPYLAVYDPPLRFTTGDLVCVRWTGLLSPSFVQSIINSASAASTHFVAITGHSVTNSPVTYISPPPHTRASLRAPKRDGEDTWCLILHASSEDSGNGERNWTMVESLGTYDTRWG